MKKKNKPERHQGEHCFNREKRKDQDLELKLAVFRSSKTISVARATERGKVSGS
jgi:hypothetical protein